MRKMKYLFSIVIIALLCSISAFAYEAESFDDYATYTAQMVFDTQSQVSTASVDDGGRFSCKRLLAEFSVGAYVPDGVNPADYVLYGNTAVYSFGSAEITENAYNILINLPDVENVIIDQIITVDSVVEDVVPASNYEAIQKTLEGNNWGLAAVNSAAYKNYVKSQAAEEVVIGIIDTGLAETHPYFKDSGRLITGYNLTSPMSGVHDYDGHGTHVTGVVVASSADNVKVKMYQIFNAQGMASNIMLNNAIQKAIDDGVDVLNMSLTTLCENKACHSSLDKAYEAGIIVVVASGNGDEKGNAVEASGVCPGHHSEHIITVGAVNSDLVADTYSNYGPEVDICAPGTKIYSTYYVESSSSFAYANSTGTSMAAPFVSAYAAMMKSIQSDMTFESFSRAMSEGAQKPDGWDETRNGVGILDMGSSVVLIENLYAHSAQFVPNEETGEITFDLKLENRSEDAVDFIIFLAFYNESGIQTGSDIESYKIKSGRTTTYSVPVEELPDGAAMVKGYVWTSGMEPISMTRDYTLSAE